MIQLIAEECTGKNPNERELSHGTKLDGIINTRFNDRTIPKTIGVRKRKIFSIQFDVFFLN